MNISFLNPFLLIGLVTVSLPIVVHLISRKSGIKKSFSAVSFLFSSQVETLRRSKIKDLILLIIRSLILVSLVLVFSKPNVFSLSYVDVDVNDVKTVAIVIDNSFSMGYGDNFTIAKNKAKSLIESLADGSFGAVIPLVPTDITEHVVTKDKRKMFEVLENIKLSFSFTDNERRLEDIFSFIGKAPNNKKEVFLFSDFQRNGWINEKFKREWLIPIDATSDSKMPNRAISDLGVKDEGDATKVSVKVSNYSNSPVDDLLATLFLDNKEIKGFFRIEPRSEQIKEFIVPKGTLNSDETTGKVEISHDNLKVDDFRYFVHSQSKEPRILLVDGDPREDTRLSETYYLARAIETISEIFPLRLSIIDNDSFLSEKLKLKDYDLLIMSNVGDISTKKAFEIEEFLRGGGATVIFLGDRVRNDLYNVMLRNVLPAEIGAISQGDYFLNANELNQFTDEMNEKFRQVEVKKVFDLHPVKKTNIILSTSYNKPYLTQRKVEKGNIFLFAATADTAWNNFPITPVFLPFIKRTLDLSLSKQPGIRQLLVGESVEIDFPNSIDEVKIRTPSGEEIKVFRANPNFSHTLIPGIYAVKEDDKALYNFSVNIDPRESNIERVSLESISSRSGIERGFVKVFKEIWIYFLWGTVALFISESIIRFLYSR